MLLKRVTTAIVTSSGGDATVYLGSKIRGYLHMIIYRPGTIVTGADLTITAEEAVPANPPAGYAAPAGTPILTKLNLGTGNSFLYPRATPTNSNSATGALGTVPSERIPLVDMRIKVVVAQGGNTLTGSIEAIYETDEL
jgi:hypothetical protein